MRYKTLFRVMMKAIGVWFFVMGMTNVIGEVARLIVMATQEEGFARPELIEPYQISSWIVTLCYVGAGLYLFFGGKWIANIAIPGNRVYCHECGYTLTESAGSHCPECGTETGRAAPPIKTVSSPTLPIQTSPPPSINEEKGTGNERVH